jgi:hypothetical protein
MNLHDIGRTGWRSPDWINEYFSPEVPPTRFATDQSVNITARDLLRAYDSLLVNRRAEWPRRPPPGHFVTPQPDADAILRDIYRFRDRMMYAGLREPELARLAFQVTREEYRALQEWIPQEGGYRGPTYERETGTMSVMGITVIPTR